MFRFALALCTLVLCSCVEMRVLIHVNRDGSAEVEKRFGMSQEISKMSPGGTSTQRDSGVFAKEGFQVKSYNADGFMGVSGTMHVNDLSLLNKALNFNQDTLRAVQGNSALKVEKGFFKNTYIMDAHLDLRGGHGSTDPTMLNAMMSSARMEFVLELPTAPAKHNATQVSNEGKTLSWKFQLGQDNRFYLEAQSWNWLNLGLSAGALILLLGSVLVLVLRRRRK